MIHESRACRRSNGTSCLCYMWKALLPDSRYSEHIAYAIVPFLSEQEEGFPRGYVMYVGPSGVDCCVFQYMRVVTPFHISELEDPTIWWSFSRLNSSLWQFIFHCQPQSMKFDDAYDSQPRFKMQNSVIRSHSELPIHILSKILPCCIFHHSPKLIHHENTAISGDIQKVDIKLELYRLAPS